VDRGTFRHGGSVSESEWRDPWYDRFGHVGLAHAEYAARSADRSVALLAERCGSLLIAGCGCMPESHVRLAAGFDRVTCMDISAAALNNAEHELGTAASYRRESIVNTALPDSLFEAVFCAHVIYHIDKDEQETAIRQLVRVTRPGGRVVIVYYNPRSPLSVPGKVMRELKQRVNARRTLRGGNVSAQIYFYAHPLGWWQRFTVECKVALMPVGVIGSRPARALLWGDRMAAAFFNAAIWFETKAPHAAVRLWQYPIVVLDKKSRTTSDSLDDDPR
jgi:SAM-dependent methyltransferase